MAHIKAASASRQAHRAFVIRLIWDGLTATWCILLKSVDGEEIRLFPEMESACLYLEGLMGDPKDNQRT